MIKYATAIRVGTATTEAILRRFIRTAAHPTYQAMLELGRAQKTIFVSRLGRGLVRGRPPGTDPAVWAHLLPYGEVRLDMAARLLLSGS